MCVCVCVRALTLLLRFSAFDKLTDFSRVCVRELTLLLRFSAFDKLTDCFSVYKVETIGACTQHGCLGFPDL